MNTTVKVTGLDIAKNVFVAVGQDDHGKGVWKRKLSRHEVLPTFANMQPMKIGIEACAGSHYWARELLRTLLIHGSRSALSSAADKPDKLLRWATNLAERRGFNVAAVALANKIARVVWALLAHGREYVPVWSNSTTRPA